MVLSMRVSNCLARCGSVEKVDIDAVLAEIAAMNDKIELKDPDHPDAEKPQKQLRNC